LRFKAPKTGKARAVTLPRFAIEELRRLKAERAEGLLGLGVRQTGETLVVYGQADGETHQPRSLTHAFAQLIRRVKDVAQLRFHDLRLRDRTLERRRASQSRTGMAGP
jgi:integrase